MGLQERRRPDEQGHGAARRRPASQPEDIDAAWPSQTEPWGAAPTILEER